MSKQKTGYREQWEEDFDWLTKCKETSIMLIVQYVNSHLD